jgi:hypothetical protein
MRLFQASAIYTFPNPSTATPNGTCDNSSVKFVYARRGHVYLKEAAYEDAIRMLEKQQAFEDSPQRPGRFAWVAFAYAASGRSNEVKGNR